VQDIEGQKFLCSVFECASLGLSSYRVQLGDPLKAP
jgi:hypothetical protein